MNCDDRNNENKYNIKYECMTEYNIKSMNNILKIMFEKVIHFMTMKDKVLILEVYK